jgi:hypothetical protein
MLNICDSFMRFLSKDTRIMTNIIRITVASSLPRAEEKAETLIRHLRTDG